MAGAKHSGGKKVLVVCALLLGIGAALFFFTGACKKESREAGKSARQTYEKSKELLQEGLEKTKDLTKEGLEKGQEAAKVGVDQTTEAAKEFQKGWKEGGK